MTFDAQEWSEGALCAQTDPAIWYPDTGGSPMPAKALCRQCPVISECLAYALENCERYGVWGGKSERERRAMRRESR